MSENSKVVTFTDRLGRQRTINPKRTPAEQRAANAERMRRVRSEEKARRQLAKALTEQRERMEPVALPESLRPRPQVDALCEAACALHGTPSATLEDVARLPDWARPNPTIADVVDAYAAAMAAGAIGPAQAEAAAAALRKLQDVTAEKPSDEWSR